MAETIVMNENATISYFMSLPKEVREKICIRLPQNTVLRLRHTCLQIQQEIDTYYPFHVKIHTEKTPDKSIQTLFNVRVQKCELVDIGGQPLPPNFKFFKHPQNLKTLEINCNHLIPSQTIFTILKESTRYIEQLQISILIEKCETLYISVFRRAHFNYQNLKKLQIRNLSFSELSILDDKANFISLRILKDSISSFSALDTVEIPIIVDSGSIHSQKVILAILSLILKHWETLKTLKIRICPVSFKLRKSNYSNVKLRDIDTILNNSNITLNTISIDFAYAIEANTELINLFRKVIKFSTSETKEFAFKKISQSTFNLLELDRIIFKNPTILKRVHLEINYPFDLTPFQECENLQSLELISYGIELRNFSNLPKSIVFMYVNGFMIKTFEMIQFFTTGLKFLKVLSLIGSGDRGDYGVDGYVFYKIFDLPSIVDVYLNPVNRVMNPDMFQECFSRESFRSYVLHSPPLFHTYRRKTIAHPWLIYTDHRKNRFKLPPECRQAIK